MTTSPEQRAGAPLLGLVHTVAALVETFDGLVAAHGGGACTVRHIVDESLLATTRARGLIPQTMRHLLNHVLAAQESGADAVLVTCSSVGPAVEVIAPLIDIPVLRVDEAMVRRALESAERIGVVATLASTLDPTVELVRRSGRALGREPELLVRLCDGAFDAARAGDRARHDALVLAEIRAVAEQVGVVLLAQASMARALADLAPGEIAVPVLTSPPLAVDQALGVLGITPRPGA